MRIREPIECPICMECIGGKNCVTTECGHKFHAKCIFTNIDRNGFNCPCCRSIMIEEHDRTEDDESIPDLVDDDESYYDSIDDSTSFDNSTCIDDFIYEDEPFNDDALRGLRLLTNLLEGVEHYQEDVVAEYNYVNDSDENSTYFHVPPRQTIERRLREQGVTY